MTNQQHPITPPPELVQQWFEQAHESDDPDNQLYYCDFIVTAAAQWGADQELESCCAEMDGWGDIHYSSGWKFSQNLRAARRPNPPSLKEQVLEKLMNLEQGTNPPSFNDYNTIRRALEALPND